MFVQLHSVTQSGYAQHHNQLDKYAELAVMYQQIAALNEVASAIATGSSIPPQERGRLLENLNAVTSTLVTQAGNLARELAEQERAALNQLKTKEQSL